MLLEWHDMEKINTIANVLVRFAETDQMGIVHHSNYAVWFELARVKWLKDRNMSYKEWEDSGVSLAVSELYVQYRNAARFDDEILVEVKLTMAKSRRSHFEYRLVRKSDEVLIATGKTTHTPTNSQGQAIRLPEQWLSQLQKYLD